MTRKIKVEARGNPGKGVKGVRAKTLKHKVAFHCQAA